MPVASPAMLSVADVSTRLALSVPAVLGLIASGRLAAANVSGGTRRPRWRIDPAELDRFLAARQSGGVTVRPVRRRTMQIRQWV